MNDTELIDKAESFLRKRCIPFISSPRLKKSIMMLLKLFL